MITLLHTSKLDIFVAVVHWPAAFEPGNGLLPPHPTKEGEVQLDLQTSLVDTWKTMIKLKETGKVNSYVVNGVQLYIYVLIGQSYRCFQLYDRAHPGFDRRNWRRSC